MMSDSPDARPDGNAAEVALTPLSISMFSSQNSQIDPEVEHVIRMISRLLDAVRGALNLPAAESLEVVLAPDLAAAVAAEAGNVIGVEGLTNFDTERIGGTVVGKTMFRDEDHRRILIVLQDGIFGSTDEAGRALALYLVAHELAHGLIGQLRSAAKSKMAATYLPWEVTRWFMRYALEEYVADCLADLVISNCGYITDSEGNQHPLTIRLISSSKEAFAGAASSALEDMARRIHRYRLDAELDSMWGEIQPKTSEILITLAHAQAEVDAPMRRTEEDSAECKTIEVSGPLRELWSGVHEVFLSTPLAPEVDEFAEIERDALDKTGELLLQFWQNIGLTFRPQDEGFYIAVAPPNQCWPGNAS